MTFPGGSDHKESTCSMEDQGWGDPLAEGMATHSSIIAWRIPMDRGAGGLQAGVTKSRVQMSDKAYTSHSKENLVCI